MTTNTPAKRVTLRDVAAAANVSLKTASNVINGNGRMAESTRKRVQQVIDELGYQVNMAARNLNRNRTGFLTLAVPGLQYPYFGELATQMIQAARNRHYSVYVTTYAEGTEHNARAVLRDFNTTVSDGLILSLGEMDDVSVEELSTEYPLVCVGARSTQGHADHVTTRDIEGAALAARHLLERGSTSLAVVGVRTPFDRQEALQATEGNAELRLRGVMEECARAGHPLDPRLMGFTGQDWSIGRGAAVTYELIDSGVPFDGIVAFNDQLAIGVLSALETRGIRVPEQVQVIGFDNLEEGAFLTTPLTSMDSCLDWISATALDRIISRIDGKPSEPALLSVTSQVVARASTRRLSA